MQYQYSNQHLNSLKNNTPKGVKLLLIINIVIFLLFGQNKLIHFLFALTPVDVWFNFNLWQCITYAFLHGGIMHLLFNMLGLWFLGYELEYRWGTKKFLQYYFIVAGGAGIITAAYMLMFLESNNPTIGASGAIYGLLIPYTILFPNRLIYIYGIFPIKVKTAAILMGSIAFFYTTYPDQQSNTSHICHLAGMIIGLGYLLYEYKFKKKIKGPRLYQKKEESDEYDLNKKHMNNILDKINNLGWEALSEEDKQYLKNESQNYYDSNKPN